MNATQQVTLRGWKEIASHMGRDVRTVQRWEERGLPVRRLPGAARGNVYAFVSELDAWLNSPLVDQPLSKPATEPAGSSLLGTDVPNSPEGREQAAVFTEQIGPWIQATKLLRIGFISLCVLGAVVVVGLAWARYKPSAPPSVKWRPSERHTSSAAGNDLYLRGVYFWNRRTPDSLNKALESFSEVARLDPTSGDAFVGLAQTYELLPEYTEMRRADAFPKALTAARHAVELSPKSADAHRVLAFALFYWEWKTDLAEKEFQLAESLDPSNAESFHWHADALLSLRRLPEARSLIARARELDPKSSTILTDQALIDSIGRPDIVSVIKELQDLQTEEPQLSSPSKYLTEIFLSHDMYDQYVSSLESTAKRFPTRSNVSLAVAAQRGWSHRSKVELLRAIRERDEKEVDSGGESATDLSYICFHMGDLSRGLKALQLAYAARDFRVMAPLLQPPLPSLVFNPVFQSMRSALMTQMRSAS